jgi:hypothetical protein
MAGFPSHLVTQKMFLSRGKIVLQIKKFKRSFKFVVVRPKRS